MSGLRQSIRLQFEALASSHHGCPLTSVLDNSPASRTAMESNQASEVSVDPFLHSSFVSQTSAGCEPFRSWIFLLGRVCVSYAVRPKKLGS